LESPVTTRQANDPFVKQAAALRAILAGNYGATARTVARKHPQREGESQTRYAARIRHELYKAGADKAGDALAAVVWK
jgi:hypothetical protein